METVAMCKLKPELSLLQWSGLEPQLCDLHCWPKPAKKTRWSLKNSSRKKALFPWHNFFLWYFLCCHHKRYNWKIRQLVLTVFTSLCSSVGNTVPTLYQLCSINNAENIGGWVGGGWGRGRGRKLFHLKWKPKQNRFHSASFTVSH